MAGRWKKRKTKSASKRKKKKQTKKSSVGWAAVIGAVGAVGLVIGAASTYYFVAIHKQSPNLNQVAIWQDERTVTEKKSPPAPVYKDLEPISPEKKERAIPAKIKATSPAPVVAPPIAGKQKPTIAIIIDDLGGDLGAATKLLSFDTPIAFSILPHLKHSKTIARRAHEKGMVVMLHLPMEAKGIFARPGPGVLTISQTDERTMETLTDDFSAVPFISGVNNHMGSLYTERSDKMGTLLDEVKKRKLFFIDSRTTPKTVAHNMAFKMGIPTARRDIFLDNDRVVSIISKQLIDLAKRAKSKGSAIGIGHPYPETLIALKETLPVIRKMGVEIKPVTELLVTRGNDQ